MPVETVTSRPTCVLSMPKDCFSGTASAPTVPVAGRFEADDQRSTAITRSRAGPAGRFG